MEIYIIATVMIFIIIVAICLNEIDKEKIVKFKTVWIIENNNVNELLVTNVDFKANREYQFQQNDDFWFSFKHNCWFKIGVDIFETQEDTINAIKRKSNNKIS